MVSRITSNKLKSPRGTGILNILPGVIMRLIMVIVIVWQITTIANTIPIVKGIPTIDGILNVVADKSNSFSSFTANSIDTVTGTVVDEEGNPLIGVNVQIKGTTKGTATDLDGRFELQDVVEDAVLVFSYIGYQSLEVSVGGRTEVQVTMVSDAAMLDEVVVVGYGEQKKVSVTGSVATVDEKELKKSSSASLASALAGRLSGLTTIQTGGGQPGRDDPTMYLRGAATTNGKSPLILIDGVPRDNIRTLDANEVASVSILKDASATAVFGVRGANGVILITTKRGEEGKMDLNVSLDQSFTSFTQEPERIHSGEYMRLRNEAAKNDGISDPPFPEEIIQKYMNPLAGLDPNDPDYEEKANRNQNWAMIPPHG